MICPYCKGAGKLTLDKHNKFFNIGRIGVSSSEGADAIVSCYHCGGKGHVTEFRNWQSL